MINKRFMVATLHKSDKYIQVKPLEVGSGKKEIKCLGKSIKYI